MARIRAKITPALMEWARTQARFSPEEAAEKIGRSVDEILAWESGESLPTIPQARKASEVYKRPLALFYMEEPPMDFETLRDFRRLPERTSRTYSPELSLLLRSTIEKQIWTRDYLISEGYEQLEFVGSAGVGEDPIELANTIRNTLNFPLEEQLHCRSRQEALTTWLRKIEQIGIYAFRQREIDLEEARGFVLVDDYAPFIFINSADSRVGQIFTIAHELVHIFLNQQGISNLNSLGKFQDTESEEIEIFCNQVASHVILEDQEFINRWTSTDEDESLFHRIEETSRTFKVSEESIARRLLEKEIISRDTYQELREYYSDRWREFREREMERMRQTEGGPSYYLTTAVKNGYSFTKTVVSAYYSGNIYGNEASSLLNVKVNNLGRLGETVGISVSRREA